MVVFVMVAVLTTDPFSNHDIPFAERGLAVMAFYFRVPVVFEEFN